MSKIGEYGLRVVKQTKDYALCFCPYHDDAHPSSVVYLDNMYFVCFGCHVKKPLEEVLEDLGVEGFSFEREREFELDLSQEHFKFTKPTDEALYYLDIRGVDVKKLPTYIVSPLNNCGVGFAFKDNKGKIIGAQVRLFPENVIGKVRFILQGKRSPMFGYFPEYLRGEYKKLVLFEKAIGCVKAQQACDNAGLSIACVSSAGSNVQRELLTMLPKTTPCFYDDDEAGRKAGYFLKKNGFDVYISKTPFDELKEEEITEILGGF